MAEELGSAATILRSAEIEDPRPITRIDVDVRGSAVPRERQPALAVRARRIERRQPLTGKARNFLGDAAQRQPLLRIAAGERPLKFRVIELERGGAEALRILEEIVDDDQRGRHARLSLPPPAKRGNIRALAAILRGC